MVASENTLNDRIIVLLPGLDGTGRLFTHLRRILEFKCRTMVISYPVDDRHNYDELCALVKRQLPQTAHIIVAESFSGPVALRVASQHPPGLQAIVLSASFATNPRPWLSMWFGQLIGAWCFSRPLSHWLIRFGLAGSDATRELCLEIQATIKVVNPDVLAFRLREVMGNDATEALLDCPVPIVYLKATRDRILGRGVVSLLLAVRPDMTVVNVPGPHMLLQSKQRLFQVAMIIPMATEMNLRAKSS